MRNLKNDWCFREMSSRQRKTIIFETIFLKTTPNKKILKVIKFQGQSSSTRGINTKKLQRGGINLPVLKGSIELKFQ